MVMMTTRMMFVLDQSVMTMMMSYDDGKKSMTDKSGQTMVDTNNANDDDNDDEDNR